MEKAKHSSPLWLRALAWVAASSFISLLTSRRGFQAWGDSSRGDKLLEVVTKGDVQSLQSIGGPDYADPAAVPESSYQCTEGVREIDRVCLFSNVFLWQGNITFVSRDPRTTVPRMNIGFWFADAKTLWTYPRVVSPDAIAAAVQSGADVARWTAPHDETYLWSADGDNYYHQVAEFFPTLHNTLCKFLGRCSAVNITGLRVVIDNLRAVRNSWPDYVNEALRCFSDHPQLHIAHKEVRQRVIAVRRLLVGIGPDCRAHNFCVRKEKYFAKEPVVSASFRGFRRRMADCLGFDDSTTAPLGPKLEILIVDRHYSSGRHILNIGELMPALQQRYGEMANLRLQYNEGLSLAEQARAHASASLVLYVHGAELGNWVFLSRHAVGIHVSIHRERDRQGIGGGYLDNLEEDLRGVTDIGHLDLMLPIRHATMRLRTYERYPQWANVTSEDRLRLLEHGECSPSLLARVKPRGLCMTQWVLKNFDIAIPPELLFPVVDNAIRMLFEKQGQAPPQWLLPG